MGPFRMGAAVVAALCAVATAAAAQPEPDPTAPPDSESPGDPPAPAMSPEEAKATARKLLDGGDQFLKKGDQYTRRKKLDDAAAQYERALTAYLKAYELVPNPQILFPIAVAEDKLGRHVDAARDFRRFLTQVASPDPALAAEAQKRLEAAKLYIGVVTLSIQPDGTHVTVAGNDLGESPLADPLFLEPGTYALAFSADGHQPLEQSLTVEAGSESERTIELVPIEVKIDLPRPPPPPPPRVELPPAPSKLPLYIGGAVTLGLLGSATITGIMAIGRHGTFTDDSGSAQEREDARVSGRRMALLTDGLIAGTVVAAGVLSFYYVKVYRPKVRARADKVRVQREQVDEYAIRPKLQVAPWVQAGGGGLVVAGTL